MILFLYYPAYIDDIPTNHGGSKPRLPIFGGSVHPVLPSRIYAHTESVLVMEVAAGDSLSNFIKQNHSKEKRSLDQLWLWINSYENTILGGMNIYIHINHIYIFTSYFAVDKQRRGFFRGFWPIPKWRLCMVFVGCHKSNSYDDQMASLWHREFLFIYLLNNQQFDHMRFMRMNPSVM